jgi:amino acid adenylation domain-containing protein
MKISIDPYPPIRPNHKKTHVPLAFQQQRILYLNQLAPDSNLWTRISCKRLHGRIDVPALRKAVDDLVYRHGVLRAKVHLSPDGPTQSLHWPVHNTFKLIQLADAGDPAHNGSKALAWLNKAYRTPIDVNGGMLFNAILLDAGEEHFFLILKLHHLISDATTFRILWKDLKALYNANLNLKGPRLPEVDVDYFDYVHWQRRVLVEPHLRNQEQFWLDHFGDDPPALDLPADRPPAPDINFRGARQTLALSTELLNRLEAFSLDRKVIVFSTLLGAYFLLLSKYCRQNDLIVGTVLSGRHYSPELRHIAGFFINTIALRMQIDPDMTLETTIRQVHEGVVKAYRMQDYPFEKLIEKLVPGRRHQRNPLFQAMFNVVKHYREATAFAGVRSEAWVEPEIVTTQVDLLLDVHLNPDGSEIRIEYNTDLFHQPTIVRLLNHYRNVLEQIVHRPETKVARLTLLDPQEQERLIHQWNQSTAPYPTDKCLFQLFEDQARITPQQTAVCGFGVQLTYGELNAKANQLARVLRNNGVGPGCIVAVLFERSLEMMIGLMAVLKAGGAYLPIDTACPAQRLRYMLADSGARLLLTQASVPIPGLERGNGEKIKILVVDAAQTWDMPSGNLASVSTPRDSAYVMYTSGSTGKPKAVVIEHRAILNTLTFLQKRYRLGPGDTYLLKTPYTFDVSVAELFGWFFEGGRLALLEPGAEKEPQKILDAITRHGVTHLNFVPSMLDLFLDVLKAEDIANFNSVKYVLAAGEALTIHLARKFRNTFADTRLDNLYGPTEASIYATVYSLDRSEPIADVPIGKPIDNMRAYVLDDHLQIQPVGVTGELYLSGAGLARGYLNASALTAERFVDDPFWPGEKMYRTGDLVKWRDDGNIQFCGRIDHQVKIRGFRIELGEIEKTVLAHPSVKEAVVIAKQTDPEHKQLVACVVPAPGHDLCIEQLRAYLGQWLPDYMVPAGFVKLDRMPLNPNGKIDRGALAALQPQIQATASSAAPPTAVERLLIGITEKLLNIKGLDANSNFFELGGNSLLTIRYIAAIEAAFKINLSIIEFINLPTISAIGKKIEPLLPPGERRDDYGLSD